MIWHGCYDESWKGLIVDEAFAHPAKMARGLIVRIFDYLLERGYVHRGDLVADPFGGRWDDRYRRGFAWRARRGV